MKIKQLLIIALMIIILTLIITKVEANETEGTEEESQIVTIEKDKQYKLTQKVSVKTLPLVFALEKDEISNEKVPIILDESFAYYDDERLKNILNYLVNEFNDRQIIIFTCSHREKDILTQENIHYNFVTI